MCLLQNGELVDMTLAADGHVVKVHQVLIALASPYLKELITSIPSQHPVIFLNVSKCTDLTDYFVYYYVFNWKTADNCRISGENQWKLIPMPCPQLITLILLT